MTAEPPAMAEEILSIAVFNAVPGKGVEAVQVLRELDAALRAKRYSRDVLYEDAGHPGKFVLLRYWGSVQQRTTALQDIDLHDYWAQLTNLIQVEQVFERLQQTGNL